MTVRALSIMQPWAWLIVAGHKDIENRSWPTSFRGPVLIHAGKRLDPDLEDAQDWPWRAIDRPDDFEVGGIVGEAEIVDCVTASASPSASDRNRRTRASHSATSSAAKALSRLIMRTSCRTLLSGDAATEWPTPALGESARTKWGNAFSSSALRRTSASYS